MKQWLIYALGGGFGHLTRAAALARAALPRFHARIVTNSQFAAAVQQALPEIEILALDPAITVGEVQREMAAQIEKAAPDCLIVDCFPRGLAGELVDLLASFAGLKVFVQRDLNPQYVVDYHLQEFVERHYDLILAAGDTTPFRRTSITHPWLVRSRHELLTRSEARAFLQLHEERPCILVCGAGSHEEINWFGEVAACLLECAPACDVRAISPVRASNCPPQCWRSYWPAIDLFAAADVVIGGAGYNTVYECLACGVPLIARPWPRKYDRQSLRARRNGIRTVSEPQEAVAAALEWLACERAADRRGHFQNGAPDAVRLIASNLRH